MKYLKEILELPLNERIHLVETIWDSIALESTEYKVPGWQIEESLQRLEEYKKDPSTALTLDEFKSRLLDLRTRKNEF
jgi:putative addiction module component (TIGR02574 family)